MAYLLDNTAKISSAIQDLFRESRGEKLVLITPYLQISRQFRSELTDLQNFRTPIKVIVRQGEKHNPEDISFLQENVNITLSTVENLHAKCYLNHESAIISSMNLYEYSQLNNVELGILVTKEDDPDLYEQINETVKRIERQSAYFEFEIKKVKGDRIIRQKESVDSGRSEKKVDRKPPEEGYCIRCGAKIQFNPEKPFCDSCDSVWKRYKDPKYPEKYCHVCGEDKARHKSCFKKPMCYACYKKLFK